MLGYYTPERRYYVPRVCSNGPTGGTQPPPPNPSGTSTGPPNPPPPGPSTIPSTRVQLEPGGSFTVPRPITIANIYRTVYVDNSAGEDWTVYDPHATRLIQKSFGFYHVNRRTMEIREPTCDEERFSFMWLNNRPEDAIVALEYTDYLLTPHVYAKRIAFEVSHDAERWTRVLTWDHEYSTEPILLPLPTATLARYARLLAIDLARGYTQQRFWALRSVRIFTTRATAVQTPLCGMDDGVQVIFAPGSNQSIITNLTLYPMELWV